MSKAWIRTANTMRPFPQQTALKHQPPARPLLPRPLAFGPRGLHATGVGRAWPSVGMMGRTRPEEWKGSEGCCTSLSEPILQVPHTFEPQNLVSLQNDMKDLSA